jgi:hypothetical protein
LAAEEISSRNRKITKCGSLFWIAALKDCRIETPDPKRVRQNLEEARASPSLLTVNEPDVIALFGQSDEPQMQSLLFEENSLFPANN